MVESVHQVHRELGSIVHQSLPEFQLIVLALRHLNDELGQRLVPDAQVVLQLCGFQVNLKR